MTLKRWNLQSLRQNQNKKISQTEHAKTVQGHPSRKIQTTLQRSNISLTLSSKMKPFQVLPKKRLESDNSNRIKRCLGRVEYREISSGSSLWGSFRPKMNCFIVCTGDVWGVDASAALLWGPKCQELDICLSWYSSKPYLSYRCSPPEPSISMMSGSINLPILSCSVSS